MSWKIFEQIATYSDNSIQRLDNYIERNDKGIYGLIIVIGIAFIIQILIESL